MKNNILKKGIVQMIICLVLIISIAVPTGFSLEKNKPDDFMTTDVSCNADIEEHPEVQESSEATPMGLQKTLDFLEATDVTDTPNTEKKSLMIGVNTQEKNVNVDNTDIILTEAVGDTKVYIGDNSENGDISEKTTNVEKNNDTSRQAENGGSENRVTLVGATDENLNVTADDTNINESNLDRSDGFYEKNVGNKESIGNEESSETDDDNNIFLLGFSDSTIVSRVDADRSETDKKGSGTPENAKDQKTDSKKMKSDSTDNRDRELVLSGMKQGKDKTKKSKKLECRYNPLMDITLSDEEYEILCRIVEAEAGDQDVYGRILVANVILNRTQYYEFPDTVKDVVFQVNSKGAVQFSPVSDGSFYRVTISEKTKEAVNSALAGNDYSDGALYFFMRSATSSEKASWFDSLNFIMKYGCHEFFK